MLTASYTSEVRFPLQRKTSRSELPKHGLHWIRCKLFGNQISVKTWNFFRAVVESILLYGSATWTLTKTHEKLIDGTYTRMMRAALNISWRQHPTKEQLYGNIPSISMLIRKRRLRFTGHCFRSKKELISELILWNSRYGHRSAGRPKITYLDVISRYTGLLQEDLETAMMDRYNWKGRVSLARATRSTR